MSKIYIGIDPGVHTGLAVYCKAEKTMELHTMMIHQAFDLVRRMKPEIASIVIENPNLWTHFKDGKEAKARLQGAGSVKRDYRAWVDFLTDEGIAFEERRPDKSRNRIATDRTLFAKVTGYKELCSEHSRVAAMLVFGK